MQVFTRDRSEVDTQLMSGSSDGGHLDLLYYYFSGTNASVNLSRQGPYWIP